MERGEMTEKQLTRRSILGLAAGSAAAALLAACGGGSSATNTPSTGGAKATTIQGGTGGQTPAPAAATSAPAATAASSSAAVATKPAGSVAVSTAPAASAASSTTTASTGGLLPLPPATPNPNVKGNVLYWQTTFDDPNLPSAKYHDQWLPSLKTTLPNVTIKEEQFSYNDMLDKLRVASRAGQGPDTIVVPILWGPEFAYAGALSEINLADLGFKAENFWPGALKSLTVNGKLYGVPTNNETMAMAYNTDIFQKAGLDPTKGPDTWEDVKNFSKQIKEKTGKAGFGLVAKLNAGNTPFRYMPLSWAYGGGALDEATDNPTYQKSMFDSDGNIQALQWIQDVYTNGWAPQSSLTNTQVEVRDLFVSGEVAMIIDLPGVYNIVKNKTPDVAAKMAFTLMPKGPVRRAAVFGGSNMIVFKSAKDQEAAKAVVKDQTSPPWSLRLHYESSNPGNRDGFNLPEEKIREENTKFLDVTIQMLQYGISFPAIPESSDIMNLYVPQMMQDVMTKAKTPQQSGQDTAKKINDLIAKRK